MASGRPRLYKNISAGILMRVGNGSLRATWNPDQPLSVGCGVKCFASPEKLGESECLYLVNYYGQLTDEKILAYQKIFGNIIVDHTHAFFQKPLKGVDTLYSCRKFWGVSDGAYLSTDAVLPMDKPVDHSNKRMGHILGRYEENAGVYYQEMLQNAARYEGMEIRRMSRLTENLLGAIDYETGRRKREENYRILSEALPSEFILPG